MTLAAAEEASRSALFDTAPAGAPPIYPTRLRTVPRAHRGRLPARCGHSKHPHRAGRPTRWAVIKDVLSKLPFVHLHSGLSATGSIVVWQLRMPRMVLGGIVGAMLAVAGASYQGVFSNPLADPYLLGIASGAGAGATIVIVEGPALGHLPSSALPPAAFLGGVVAVAGHLRARAAPAPQNARPPRCCSPEWRFPPFSWRSRRSSCNGAAPGTSPWSTAGSSVGCRRPGGDRSTLSCPTWRSPQPSLFACRRLLDVLTIGDEEATSVGVRASRVRLIVIVAATLGTAAAVSVSGLIGFVGIIVPHTIRLIAGPSYRRIIPLSLLFGAGFPHPCRHSRPDRTVTGRGPARGRYGLPGRPVLPRGAPPSDGGWAECSTSSGSPSCSAGQRSCRAYRPESSAADGSASSARTGPASPRSSVPLPGFCPTKARSASPARRTPSPTSGAVHARSPTCRSGRCCPAP